MTIYFYSHFGLKSAFITAGTGLLKRVQPFSPAMHHPLKEFLIRQTIRSFKTDCTLYHFCSSMFIALDKISDPISDP